MVWRVGGLGGSACSVVGLVADGVCCCGYLGELCCAVV